MDSKTLDHCQFAQLSDVGCVRDLNEDSLYSGESLWLVADGMGGHACGEVASQIAASAVAAEFSFDLGLVEPIVSAHKKIVAASLENEAQSGMGTTIVALCCLGRSYQVAWVGDSRAYLWDGPKHRLTQLSEDHSLIVRLLKSGLIKESEAHKHPQRHMITQCLGSADLERPQVDTRTGLWEFGQQILLCSDGLSDELTDQEIAKVMGESGDLEAKVHDLVGLAKSKGGQDNISVILVASPVTTKPGYWQALKNKWLKNS